ncbi:MAG: histidine phosphatase family protein [bacterium]
MAATRIYLIRHAETLWNNERRYQGTLNSPLSEAGWDQSYRTRDALRGAPLRAVYSSPLVRAQETADVIAEPHGLPVVTVDGLSEIRVGEWEGLTTEEIEARYAEAVHQWYTAPHLARIPGGETIEEMRLRAVSAFEEIRTRHDGQTLAVIAHGGVNKSIILTALGAPLAGYWRIRQHNACINVLEYEGTHVRVILINETAHLGTS